MALCVRGIYLWDSSDNPTFATPIVDALTYDGLARDLVSGQPMTSDFFWQPAFYPWFLAFLYWLGSGSILFVKIVQAVLGAVTAGLTFRIGERIFGRGVGTLAGLMTAVYIPLVFFELELLAAGWAAFWMAAMVLVLIKIREKPSFGYCCLFGLIGTLAVITRPVFLLLFGVACLWLVIVWGRARISLSKMAPRALGLVLGFLVIASPVWIVSHRVTGKASLLPYSGGINLYIGNNPEYEETITVRPGLAWRELTSAPARQGIVTDQEMQRFFLDKTRQYAVNEPVHFGLGLMTKTAQFVSAREMPRNTDIYLFRKWSWMLSLLVWKIGGFGFPFGVLLPLVVVGLVVSRRRPTGPLWLPVVFYPLSVIAVFVAARYRVPLVPVMCVWASAGLWGLREMVQQRQWNWLALAGVIVLGIGAAGSLPGPFYEEKLDYEAELYYGLGSAFDEYGQVERAKTAYTRAIGLKPDYAEALYNLANILKSQGRLAEAVDLYRQSLGAAPESVEVRTNFAAALRSQGEIEEAVEQWEKVLEIDPDNPFAHFNLGEALAGKGEYDRSEGHFEEALRVRPDWVDVHLQWGLMLFRRGDSEGAVSHFAEVLKVRPDDAEVLCNMGIALGSAGRLEEAVSHFRRAVRLEPGSVSAHYNLGYALELQGKLAEAREEYRRVLQINPDHTETRRRLEALKKRCQAPSRKLEILC